MIARKLTKSFPGRTLFKDFSLTVGPGESVAIMGPSGCGKSTLLHILGLLEQPTSGIVRYSKTIAPLHILRRQYIGFLFQTPTLHEHESARDNILLPARLAGLSADIQRADALLEQINVPNIKALHLSLGQRQRVALARALFLDPPFLLCDEPTASLDVTHAKMVLDLLFASGKGIVCVTHDRRLAERCGTTRSLEMRF